MPTFYEPSVPDGPEEMTDAQLAALNESKLATWATSPASTPVLAPAVVPTPATPVINSGDTQQSYPTSIGGIPGAGALVYEGTNALPPASGWLTAAQTDAANDAFVQSVIATTTWSPDPEGGVIIPSAVAVEYRSILADQGHEAANQFLVTAYEASPKATPVVVPVVNTGDTQQAYPTAISAPGSDALVNDDGVPGSGPASGWQTASQLAAVSDAQIAAIEYQESLDLAAIVDTGLLLGDVDDATASTAINANTDPYIDQVIADADAVELAAIMDTGLLLGDVSDVAIVSTITENPNQGIIDEFARQKDAAEKKAEADAAAAAKKKAEKEAKAETRKDAWETMVEQYSDVQVFDTYDVPDASLITFACKNKGLDGPNSIQGILVDPLGFSLDSKWEHKALGIIGDSNTAQGLDVIGQLGAGISVNQPILNRRTWGGTDPLSITVKVRFLARGSGANAKVDQVKADVYDKIVALSTLLIPRMLGKVDGFEGILSSYSIPGPSPFGGELANLIANKLSRGDGADTANYGGDPVSVLIGSTAHPLVFLNKAYITKLQGTFTKALGPGGYPLGAEATITFGAMDTPMLQANKDGVIQGVAGNNIFLNSAYASEDILKAAGELITSVQTAADKAAEAKKAAAAAKGESPSEDFDPFSFGPIGAGGVIP